MSREDFCHELADLINRYSLEHPSDTPDFVLAAYLLHCLDIFAFTVKQRDQWFDFDPWSK